MLCPKCNEPMSDSATLCPTCSAKEGGASPFQDAGSDWLTTLLLAIFLGKLGVHRFYTGNTGRGLLMLFTLGCCGILWIYDIILIVTDQYRDHKGRPLVRRL